MAEKKKSGKNTTEKIVFITAILTLLSNLIGLILKLTKLLSK